MRVLLCCLLALVTTTTLVPRLLSQQQTGHSQKELSAPLEIRLTKSPQWEKDCLTVGLDRINHSSLPLFLPVKGLYVEASVNRVSDAPGKPNREGWVNVYGASDLGDFDAHPIGPGVTLHDELCFSPTLAVVSLKRKTRREIQLRGKLKVDAYYFLTEKDWQKNKAQHEEMFRTSPSEWKNIVREDPKVVTVFVKVPCQTVGCDTTCEGPPVVLQDEARAVPDVFDSPEWAARGRAVREELVRKYPACSETTPAHR